MIDSLLLSELRTAAVGRLLPALGQVLEKTDDALFDVWQQGLGGQSQRLFDALRELRRQRSSIESAVGDVVAAAFDALAAPPVAATEARLLDDDLEGTEFSLLESDVLEEQLTCERLATAIDRRQGEALTRLARVLVKLTGRASIEGEELPLSPLLIAKAWRDALAPVLDVLEWRLVAYKHLERGLAGDLGNIVDELCRLLQSRGVALPAPLQRPRIRRTDPPARSRPQAAEGGNTERWDGEDSGVPGRWVPDPVDGESNGYSGEPRGDGPDPVYEAMREMFAAYLGDVRKKKDGEAEAEGHGAVALPGQPTTPGSPSTPVLDSPAAILVLSRLQRQPTPALQRAVDNPQVELVELLRSELLSTAVSLGRAPAGAQLEAHDEQALMMVGMLFDTLLDQGTFSRDVRERMIRLYVPYAKVAMLDRRLFAQKLHPARRLLNLLAEASDGNVGEAPAERELLAKVFAISERLIDSFEEDPVAFVAAEAEFSDFLTRHRRRTALAEQRAAEAQRGRERLEEARLEVNLELDSLVGRRQVPKPIGEFLRRDWTHHLTMIALRDGVESDAFREARAPGVRLWMALLACEGGAPPPPGLADQLLPAMLSAGQAEDAARVALGDIGAALRASMPKPAEPAPAVPKSVPESVNATAPPLSDVAPMQDFPVPEPAPPALDPEPEVAPEPSFELVSAAPEPMTMMPASAVVEGDRVVEANTALAAPDLIEQVKSLEVGAWVEFVEPDGSSQPAKLSWISPISSRMLFVNRRGLRICTLSAEELAALIADGKLNLRHVDDAFDRAMSQVLDRLREGVKS